MSRSIPFFGEEVTHETPVSVEVPWRQVLNLQMAALGSVEGSSRYVLHVETENNRGQVKKCVLCNLRAGCVEQQKIDICFSSSLVFSVVGGPGSIFLTGYFQPAPEIEDLAGNDDVMDPTKVDNSWTGQTATTGADAKGPSGNNDPIEGGLSEPLHTQTSVESERKVAMPNGSFENVKYENVFDDDQLQTTHPELTKSHDSPPKKRLHSEISHPAQPQN